MSGKKIESNVPMWEIDGNSTMQNYAEEIAGITLQMKNLENELQEMNDNVEILNKRINIYLGNIFGIQDFEQSKYAIIVKEDYKIEIYNVDDIELDEDGEYITEELPEPLLVHKSNTKQTTKILNQLREYNDLIDDFNICFEDCDDYLEAHKLLWSEVKHLARTIKFFSTATEEGEEIEVYNEEKHVLLIAQNSFNEWGFKYIRKEDEDSFNQYLYTQLELEEEDEDE